MYYRTFISMFSPVISFLIMFLLVAADTAPVQAQTTQPAGMPACSPLFRAIAKSNGIFCLPRVEDPSLALALAESQAMVYALNPDPQKVIEFRRMAVVKGLLGKSIYFDVGTPDNIPLADNYADVVILDDFDRQRPTDRGVKEIKRVLCPGGKIVTFDNNLLENGDKLKKIFPFAARIMGVSIHPPLRIAESPEINFCSVAETPLLPGAADWGMWFCGADNNAMSADTALKTPYQTQFIDRPIYVAAPSLTLAAGGRVFVYSGPAAPADVTETANTLYARNGYNGTILWTTRYQGSKEQANNPGDVLAVTPEWVLLAEGSRLRGLDAGTGQLKTTLEIPGLTTDIKSVRVSADTVYLLDSAPDGTTVVAWALPAGTGEAQKTSPKNPVWSTKEDAVISPRMLGVRDGRVLFCTTRGVAKCLDARTGTLLWQNDAKEFVGKMALSKFLPTDYRRALGMSAGVVLTPKLAFFRSPLKKVILALSLADGKLLNTLPAGLDYSNMSVFYDPGRDKIYTVLPPEGDGKKGKPRPVTLDPETGKILSEDCPLALSAGQCERMTANLEQSLQRGGTWGAGYSRTACNNGKVTANGALYIVSTAHCRCIQTIAGLIGLSSAGSDNTARPKIKENITRITSELTEPAILSHVISFPVEEKDWKEYRANPQHSASVPVTVGKSLKKLWETSSGVLASAATSFNGRLLIGREDGQVQCLFAQDGQMYWSCPTGGPVRLPPLINADGMDVIVGSMDGYLYILNSADGRIFRQFRPTFEQERKINLYGHLSSSRPLITGVAVGQDGTIYAAAGMLNIDGTCVYALKDDQVLWQNAETSLKADQGEGISLIGHLALAGDKLLIPAKSQPSPLTFDAKTGKLLEPTKPTMAPFYPTGREVMVWNNQWVIYGGRPLFSPLTPIVRSGFSFGRPTTFCFYRLNDAERALEIEPFGMTAVPPTWDNQLFVAATYMDGELCAWEPRALATWLEDIEAGRDKKYEKSATFGGADHQVLRLKDDDYRRAVQPAGIKWGPLPCTVASLALAADAVVVVMSEKDQWQAGAAGGSGPTSRPAGKWFLRGLDRETGKTLWEAPIDGTPTPEAICIDRDGRIIIGLTDGRVQAYGAR